ncbi:MAG: RES family NAD+ phosphorylase [Pseudomonadota bacterium]|nr:RES family NAD+ phosphorylase [Pseudomonadota bacterium]
MKARLADTALDGSGAKAHGGRWNSKGVAMVYASESVSLAALELLVHLHRGEILNQYLLPRLKLSDDSIMSLDKTALPKNWRRDPPPSSTADIGDQWALSLQSLALIVPSTIVPQQRNVLLNPGHPGFGSVIATASSEPFDFDPRLAR